MRLGSTSSSTSAVDQMSHSQQMFALPSSGSHGVKLRLLKRSPEAGGGEHVHQCDRVQIPSLASEGLSQFWECKVSFKGSKQCRFCRCLSYFETGTWTDCECCGLLSKHAATVLEQAVK